MGAIDINVDDSALIARAREYESTGRQEIALLILEGGVIRLPDAIPVLEEYVALARSVALNLPADQQAQQFGYLASFVQARIPFVKIEYVDRVVAVADAILQDAETALNAEEQTPQLSKDELDIWEAAKAGTLAVREIASTDAHDAAKLLEKILEHVSKDSADCDAIKMLQQGLDELQYAQAFDMALADANLHLDRLDSSDGYITGYLLQQVDQTLRNLAIETTEIASWRRQQLTSAIQRLSAESEQASIKAKIRDADARFNAVDSKVNKDIAKLEAMADPISTDPDGALQKKLQAIQEPIQRLLEVSPMVSGTTFSQQISDKLQDLHAKAMKWSRDQQQRYDRWALANIRKGYESATKHISRIVLDDEKQIAEEIIKHFAEIDVRLLSPEVQRTYSDIFEIVFGRLNAPKKDEKKDYEDKGGKLYTLKQMMEKTKKTLSDF